VTDNNRPQSQVRTFIWAIVLGFVGFVCGAMGQSLLLAQMDNAAPVLGVIIGPIGLAVGAYLGELSTRYHLSTRQNLIFLAIAVVVGSVGTLYLTVSEYNPAIRLVDAEVVSCEQVDQLLASQTKWWSDWAVRVAREGHRKPRPNWEQEIPDMLRAQPGVVLTIRIHQEAWVREQKWRWGEISKRVDSWKSVNETKQVFATIAGPGPAPLSACDHFVIGERRFSALAWENTNVEPPNKLQDFLWLYALQQVPPEYIQHIPKSK